MPHIEEDQEKPTRPRDAGAIYIDVKAYGGAHIPTVIREMSALADKLSICVWADLNGTRTLCRPGDDPAETLRAWDKEQSRDSRYRYASA